MKKLLRILGLGLLILSTTSAYANEQQFLQASYGGCEGQIAGKTIPMAGREALCAVGPLLNMCFTKIGKTLLRSYAGAKQKVYTEWVAVDDSINEWFFSTKNNDDAALLVSKLLIKGHKGQMVCGGKFRKLSGDAFVDELKKWQKEVLI